MRDYFIKTSPFEFLSIKEISISKGINKHGSMILTGYIADEKESMYLKLLTNDTWVKVEAVDSEEKVKTLFCGTILEFSIDDSNDQKMMTLSIVSGTYEMDLEPHTRTYMDLGYTYGEIFEQLTKNYYENGFIEHKPLDKKIGDIIIQYEETDWEFLKRIASRLHSYLVSNTNREGVKFCFDLPKGKRYTLEDNIKYRIKKDLDEYARKIKAGMYHITEEDCTIFIVKDREIYEIGDNIVLKGHDLYVSQIESTYVGSEMLHTYYLKREAGMQTLEIYNEDMRGCSLDCVVVGVKEDKVQVTVNEDENKEQCITKWFLYSTVYSSADGTGWYCMPEIEDLVRLYFPTKKEEESFIISAVHLGTESSDRKNPEEKMIKNKHQKEIRFTPNAIVITNNKGTKIELTDEDGINIVSSNSVAISALENLTISSETSSLMVAGTTSVTLQQKGTSIQMNEGISFTGGEFKVQ